MSTNLLYLHLCATVAVTISIFFSWEVPAKDRCRHLFISMCFRTGSAMERRAITPPVGSPVGRPLYLPPQDKSLLSLDKIAKRECKVLVVDPICSD